ncbi:UDP-glycosyltransferase 83A1 [Citrus sinensis]|uniref:UDP-glycosyltransferase 83A1 n=1 Tax=Citrus sinensis TaxID=2711 RepID=A0ACB8LWR3_CITSI|nr:UDP-glycosyltransferase 83A1 [Citrus sinensis]
MHNTCHTLASKGEHACYDLEATGESSKSSVWRMYFDETSRDEQIPISRARRPGQRQLARRTFQLENQGTKTTRPPTITETEHPLPRDGKLTSLPIVCWPTILVIPFPAQGHVAPLMKLATKIAENGIEVTFVNTEFIHAKIIASMQGKAENSSSQMMLVSIPDGLDLQADEREDPHKLMIEDPQADTECSKSYARIVGWALEVAEAIVIARAAFVPFGPGSLALSLHIPKLLDAAIIDPNGFAVLNYGLISLSNEIPALNRNEYTWSFPTEPNIQKIFFGSTCATVQAFKISKWVLNNSVYELDSPACDLIPSVLPFGPLDLEQLEQLALGIESLHQPFLRVVRPDFMKISLEPHGADPNDFQKVRQSMLRVMPGSCLKNLVEKVSESNDCQQIMFVIVDVGVGWTMEVAERWESRELHSFSPVASYS